MDEENVYLKRWITLKDEKDLSGASTAVTTLFVLGAMLSILLAFLILLEVHSIFVAIVSLVLGWSIAERNALRTRIKLWPHLEKYLNWEAIRGHISR